MAVATSYQGFPFNICFTFFIGSWNTTDLVPKPTECYRRIFASLHPLLIDAMKIASKQADACKKKSFINQKITYPAQKNPSICWTQLIFHSSYLCTSKKTPLVLLFLIGEWWVQSYFSRNQDIQSFQPDHRIRAKTWKLRCWFMAEYIFMVILS